MRRVAPLCLLVLALAGCGDAGGGVTSAASEPTGVDQAAVRAEAWDACKDEVTDQLKAPATAVFPDYEDDDVDVYTSEGNIVISAVVDSENSFGALLRSTWECTAYVSPAGNLQRAEATVADN